MSTKIEWAPNQIEYGMCQCGCGKKAPIANHTNKKRGIVKGQPLRYIQGHNGKNRPSGRIEFVINKTTGCWEWKRSLTSKGYGHLTINNKQILAHRFLYEQQYGPIPEGYELDHLCGNKACINPLHLEPVSHAENCRRGPRAKLTWNIVKDIRDSLSSGIPRNQLAEKYEVDISTIRNIANNKAWNEYPEVRANG